MRFSEIPGNEPVKARLREMASSGRLPHALLLEGAQGRYKLAMANAMATLIHCQNPTPDGDSCGRCAACLQHKAMTHIDTLWVYPVVKTDKLKHPISDDFAEQWKEFIEKNPEADPDEWTLLLDKKGSRGVIYVYESASLIHKLSLTAHSDRHRVIIVWLPERMNEETANKLLKAVEEPFPGTMFIMVSDSPREILPTIYSRLQRMEVMPLSDREIADKLEKEHGIDSMEAMAIASRSGGDIIKALRETKVNAQSAAMLEGFISLMRLAYQRRVGDLKNWAANMAAEKRDYETRFYANAQRLVRENFVYNLAEPSLIAMDRAENDFSRNFARFITEANVEKLIEVFNNAMTDIAANANDKIVNFDTALKVCFLLKH